MQIAKSLILLGTFLLLGGFILWGLSKAGIAIGKLPGDISMKKERFSFHFPIVTSIVVSIVLTILLNLFFWFFRR